MSKLKEISRQSTTSWSPISQYPDYMAVGTVAGTIGVDFDTSSKLEIYSLDITNELNKEMTLKGSTTSSTRFNKLVWGQASSTFQNGIIAGAMDNGSINLWDPSKILSSGSNEESNVDSALIGVGQRHQGPVNSIDFNVQNPNLLASGGSDSEVFIWDLTDPTQPSAHNPGSKSQQSSDITCVAWNKKVPHILGSSSYNGYIVIWDLKSKKTLMTINDRSRKCKYRSIVWHPSEATQIVAASEDDEHPVIQTWDLRNSNSPIKSMEGHKKGVWGLSWCPSDSALLLSTGKDNKTFCWNFDRQEILCEINDTANSSNNNNDPNAWNFEVQWSPRVPALLSTSSFVGKVNVFSLQDVNERTNTSSTPQLNALGIQETPTIGAPTIKHTPNWLLRPCGAAFGFGGKIATFGRPKKVGGATSPTASPQSSVTQQSRIIHISHVTTEKEIVKSSEELENVIQTGQYEKYCQDKIDQATSDEEKSIWGFLKVKFAQDDRLKILDYLGYDIETIKNELKQFLGTLPELPIERKFSEEKEKEQEEITTTKTPPPSEENGAATAENNTNDEQVDADSFFDAAANKQQQEQEQEPTVAIIERSKSPIQFPGDEKEQMITKALLVGDHSSAVECCLRLGRYSDALILAHAAGQDLWKKTQEAYFEIVKSPFGKVVSCIVKRDFDLLVKTSDLKDWKASLAILCTYAAPSDFKVLSGILGDRLDKEADDLKSAILCFICAGDIDKTVDIWTRVSQQHQQQQRKSLTASGNSISVLEQESNKDLQNLIEKVSIFRSACGNNNSLNQVLSMKYAKYAEILASQGNLSASLRYLAPINIPQCQKDCGVLFDRVYRATSNHQGINQPPFPFQLVEVYSSSQPKPQPQPLQQQQQQHFNRQPVQQQQQQQQQMGQHQHNQSPFGNVNQNQMMNNNNRQPPPPTQPQTLPFGTNPALVNNTQPPVVMRTMPPTSNQQPPAVIQQNNMVPPPMGGNNFNAPPPMGGNSFNAPPPQMGGNSFSNTSPMNPMMMNPMMINNQAPPPMGGNNFGNSGSPMNPMMNTMKPPMTTTQNFNTPPPMNPMVNPMMMNPTAPPMGSNQSPMINNNQNVPPPMNPMMMMNNNQNPQQASPPPMNPAANRSPNLTDVSSKPPSTNGDFNAPAPKPNVHNKTPSILTGQLGVPEPTNLPTSEETEKFVERLTRSIQELNGKADIKVWEDANKRCQALINKVSKKDISGEAFRALDAILTSIVEKDFKKASDTYIQITSTPLWAEVGSQSMVGLKRLIDLGLKTH